MSSGVVIINKTGVAVAADSAVTIGSRSAIFNTAQKIYPIGKASVCIVNYGAGTIMGVPVEVLFKEFSAYIGEQQKKNTVEDYGKTFLEFLVSESTYFNFPNNEERLIKSWLSKLLSEILHSFEKKEALDDKLAVIEENYQRLINIAKLTGYNDINNPFQYSHIEQKHPDIFNEVFINYFTDQLDRNFKKDPLDEQDKQVISKLKDIAQKISHRSYFYPSSTGVCFVGYGQKQIYPSLFHIRFYGVVQKKPIFFVEDLELINDDLNSMILPLAQMDMIHLIIRGTNSEISDYYYEYIEEKNIQFLKEKLSQLPTDQFNSEEFFKAFQKHFSEIQVDYPPKLKRISKELMNTVKFLPLTDLSLLAEDLINIQTLRRKYESSEEWNGTVGGPTDVATITKVDGFKWIKNSK
jgi:hypothetical protein